jgi:hypothetical protein
MTSYRRIAIDVILILGVFGLIGELSFRLPGSVQKIAYSFDDELAVMYRPDQVGVMFLGNFSVQTPKIVINNRGFRGAPIEPARPSVLLCGSSEIVGPGSEEDETLPAQLERILGNANVPHQVINLGVGGYGPYHHRVVAERFVEELSPDLVIIRVSSGDRYFHKPTVSQLEQLRAARLRNDRVASISRFFPFLYNKLQAQLLVISTLRSSLFAAFNSDADERASVYAKAESTGAKMWDVESEHWIALMGDTEAQDFNLLFFVPNPLSRPADTLLADRLRETARVFPRVKVVEFDTDSYEVPQSKRDQLASWYADEYTLGYDPHGNAKHHAFLAAKIAEVTSKDLLVPLASELEERSAAED